MSALKETLSDLRDAFSRLELGWYVFGAQALNLHGFPRMTADVDVTISPPNDTEKLIEILEEFGFQMRVDDPLKFAKVSAVLPVVSRSNMPVDVVIGRSGLEKQFLARAERKDVGGLEIPVVTTEDLVISKVLAGRPKDLEDVRNLKSGTGLELDYVRTTLSDLEQALGVSDLLPLFDDI